MGSLCDRSHGTTLTVRKFTRLTVQKVEIKFSSVRLVCALRRLKFLYGQLYQRGVNTITV